MNKVKTYFIAKSVVIFSGGVYVFFQQSPIFKIIGVLLVGVSIAELVLLDVLAK